MIIHRKLKPRPEEHTSAVNVALRDGGLLALQLESEMLI